MNDEGINIIEFIKARSKEIEAIEKSLSVSHKKSLPWQRMAYYRRRRNRNYDKRKLGKLKHRIKDRHFLRTHTFYAKRYKMLKMNNYSIPYSSRLKNSKYIYKSESRGYFFDESFRNIKVSQIISEQNNNLINKIKIKTKKTIQYFENSYECILDEDKLITVGYLKDNNSILDENKIITIDYLKEKSYNKEYECVISVLKKYDYEFKELKDIECKIYKNCIFEKEKSNMINLTDNKSYIMNISELQKLESHKIFCKRIDIMLIFQRLINLGFIPIGLKDIERLALENDTMTIYDTVNLELYKTIEEAINKKIIEKIKKTPSGKKQEYDINKLYIYDKNKILTYFTFITKKGTCKSKGELFVNNNCIGRVVRGDYKFKCGKNSGLGFLNNNVKIDDIKNEKIFCKNLDQNNFYEIKIIKFIKT